jgi:nucleoside-diphosphate-sugar epimerase
MSDAAELQQLRSARIFVAGHRGMVGSAIVRQLQAAGCEKLLLPTRQALDLTRQDRVRDFFDQERPEYVFMAAARVGGILANSSYPADFIFDNLAIATNVIQSAHAAGTVRLLFLGSSCIYPKLAPQPMPEESLLTGPLEPSNEPYAIAKIAGIKLCESFNRQHGTDFRSVMPTNLYGPNDNFDLETSHVLPAMIRKFHEAHVSGAQSVELWGTGTPRREFLHVDDLAEACLFVMSLPRERYGSVTASLRSHLNVGTGTDVSIRELAELVRDAVGFRGEITFNSQFPDGTPRKLLDVSRLAALGWVATTTLKKGIAATYAWYREHH